VTITVPAENVHVNTLHVGDIVTFSYYKYIHNNPIILRLKIDGLELFHDLVASQTRSEFVVKTKSEHASNTKMVLWVTSMARRRFFVNYAKKYNFDPLIADNWYLQSKKRIKSEKHSKAVIGHHSNSVTKALLDLFPEIGLTKEDLIHSFKKIKWSEPNNRRMFFENYAKDNMFDPLVYNNWLLQPISNIKNSKDSKFVLSHYNMSVAKALSHLFPEFNLKPQNKWEDPRNRRKFFENYASRNKFNPLNPINWYEQPKDQIKHTKNSMNVLQYHSNSIAKALLDLFPNIGLNQTQLAKRIIPNQEKLKRRAVFENFAQEHNFDPLVAKNWYSISHTTLKQGVKKAQKHYDNISAALVDLFPEVEFEQATRPKRMLLLRL